MTIVGMSHPIRCSAETEIRQGDLVRIEWDGEGSDSGYDHVALPGGIVNGVAYGNARIGELVEVMLTGAVQLTPRMIRVTLINENVPELEPDRPVNEFGLF
jgi:hypothetical protein